MQMGRLIIDGDKVYELDEECMKKKQEEEKRKEKEKQKKEEQKKGRR